MFTTNKCSQNILTVSINSTSTPLNIINVEFINKLEEIAETINSDDSIKGAIITSSRPEFVVGADLSIFETIKTIEDTEKFQSFNQALRVIETCQKPIVAAINGTALGGGLELTLACNYRVILDDDKIQLGLPEVNLGLLPGGGGTQRLPRLIGIQSSLDILLKGKHFTPKKALKFKIANELANTPEELMEKAITFINSNPEIKQPWDKKGYRIPGGNVHTPVGYTVFPAATATVRSQTFNNYLAPQNILKSVYEGLQVPMDMGLKIEADYFTDLIFNKSTHNMIKTLFFSMNKCKRKVPKTNITQVGIIGAGVMGSGIAQNLAQFDFKVILIDINQEVLDKSTELISKKLNKKRNQEQSSEILAKIKTSTSYDSLSECQLVIEAVSEVPELKKEIISKIDSHVSANTLIATNTSTIPITELATAAKKASQFIGLHFFSPVERMKLVEIIKGKETSDQSIEQCLSLVQKIKKVPIVVNDAQGFYTSRVFITYVLEGLFALNEGISPVLIENAGKLSGMAYGPLAAADGVGLDLVCDILKLQNNNLNLDLFKLLEDFVHNQKRFGRKNGVGFYNYQDTTNIKLADETFQTFQDSNKIISADDLATRLLTIQSIESIKCLNENIVTSAHEADIGSILGWAFPAYTGGTISYIDLVGKENFIQTCNQLEKEFGERFSVTSLELNS